MTVRVAYILGEVRSGSTILDIVLGNHPEIQSTGELSWLPYCWANKILCSCGVPSHNCEFWSAVQQEWFNAIGENDTVRYVELKVAFERIRRLPRLLRDGCSSSSRFRRYAEMTYKLFEAIQKVSRKSIIVDSSKNPVRALALSMVPGIDLRPIHMVRDGRGVIWSRKKTLPTDPSRGLQELKTLPTWRSSLSWRIVNQLSEYVRRQTPCTGVLLHYKDLFKHPQEFFAQLGRALETEIDPLISVMRTSRAQVGHLIAGNRVRLNQYVDLKFDEEWKSRLSERDRQVFWLIAGSLAEKYGYTRNQSF